MSSSKLILCVLGVAAIGAVVSALLTTEKGSEVTERVKGFAEDFLKNVNIPGINQSAADLSNKA